MFLLFVSFIRISVIGFKAHSDNLEQSHLKILNLITSAKTLSPNKVTFTDSGGWDVDIYFAGQDSTHLQMLNIRGRWVKCI